MKDLKELIQEINSIHSSICQRFGLGELPPPLQLVSTDYFFLVSLMTFTFSLPATFVVLFLLEAITFEQLGILLATQMVVQVLFDYPTGALGDAIGHRRVLASAYIGYIIATIFLITAESFQFLLIYAIVGALASSQESGTLQAWYDNQYRILAETIDPKRKIYGEFMGKLQALSFALIGAAILTGGVIATVWSRKMLFLAQIVLFSLIFGLIQLRMRSAQSESRAEERPSYLTVFKEGLRFASTDKGVFLFFIGWAIIGACNYSIWGGMLLFPIYEAYGRKDIFTALLRATIFATAVISNFIWAKISSRITEPKRWIFICIGVSNPIFFAAAGFFLYLAPPEESLVLWKFLALIAVFFLFATWEGLGFILNNRLKVDLIPDRVRNAVYSLEPTLVLILSIPFIILGGIVIGSAGMEIGALLIAVLSIIGIIALGLGLLWLPQLGEREETFENSGKPHT